MSNTTNDSVQHFTTAVATVLTDSTLSVNDRAALLKAAADYVDALQPKSAPSPLDDLLDGISRDPVQFAMTMLEMLKAMRPEPPAEELVCCAGCTEHGDDPAEKTDAPKS